jgi:hypothetical protein
MLEKLMEILQSWAAASRIKFDPSSLNDLIAMQTQWTPLKRGGSSFRTHEIVTTDPNILEFKPTLTSRIFCLVFMFAGIAAMIISFSGHSSEKSLFSIEMIIPLLFGLVFMTIGSVMYYFAASPIVFDKYKASFWKGRVAPDQISEGKSIKHYSNLANIHALQIISEYCRGDKRSFYSYELNLVLKSGGRINVIDHGNIEKLKEDAQTLSSFLNKPVWDSTIIRVENNSLSQIEKIRSDQLVGKE